MLLHIHKYLRQFRYSYWWRARHVGVFKLLILTSQKYWNMGVTCELAPVLIRQFFSFLLGDSNGRYSCATSRLQYAGRAQQSPHKEVFPRGPCHFIAGGVLCWKKSLNNYNFAFFFLFWLKSTNYLPSNCRKARSLMSYIVRVSRHPLLFQRRLRNLTLLIIIWNYYCYYLLLLT